MPRLRVLPLSLLMLSMAHAALGQALTGGGATFPQPIYSKWIESFQRQHPEFAIRYDACGSEAGAQRLEEGVFDFAGSDMPLSDPQLARLPFPVVHFPTVLGAVVAIYHIAGVVADLRLTPEILAGIYLGKIRKWNDPAIRSVNHGISFPDREIVVVHRSDGSGTTFVWTDYLSKVSPEWKAAVGSGTSIHWPTGTGAPGNEGVAQAVSQTENSIGYVEFIFAVQGRLSHASVRNGSGKFVQAGLDSLAAAAAGVADRMPDDFRVSITNAPGAQAYPISSFTYLLVPARIADAGKRAAAREFLRWLLTSGQRQAQALGYGALPDKILVREREAVERLQ